MYYFCQLKKTNTWKSFCLSSKIITLVSYFPVLVIILAAKPQTQHFPVLQVGTKVWRGLFQAWSDDLDLIWYKTNDEGEHCLNAENLKFKSGFTAKTNTEVLFSQNIRWNKVSWRHLYEGGKESRRHTAPRWWWGGAQSWSDNWEPSSASPSPGPGRVLWDQPESEPSPAWHWRYWISATTESTINSWSIKHQSHEFLLSPFKVKDRVHLSEGRGLHTLAAAGSSVSWFYCAVSPVIENTRLFLSVCENNHLCNCRISAPIIRQIQIYLTLLKINTKSCYNNKLSKLKRK